MPDELPLAGFVLRIVLHHEKVIESSYPGFIMKLTDVPANEFGETYPKKEVAKFRDTVDFKVSGRLGLRLNRMFDATTITSKRAA